ncbi:MAG: respiratory nitrate reductase subunit gamma [Deltaproteobacteria bacterium]|nr:respiratory nitrate reductase subunit gamma [Deltaproteobacteria bacterium]
MKDMFTEATRQIMWNIDYAFVMYIMFLTALTVFAYGVCLRVSSWLKGKQDDDRLSQWFYRMVLLCKELFIQKKVRASTYPAIFHSFIFYAFALLVVTTAVVALDYDLGTNYFKGTVYVVLTVGAEIAGLLILVGTAMAIYRRYVIKRATLSRTGADAIALSLLAVLVVTGFIVEGLRMAASPDPWYYLSPVGYLVSLGFSPLSHASLVGAHKLIWWLHTLVAMGWIASIPYTKFSHILTLPLNVYFQKLRPRGELKRDDLEALMNDPNVDYESLTIGLQKPEDFTWKQRLDFDACIECGRCEEVCPAVKAGSDFSPKLFIGKCRELARESSYASDRGNGADAAPGGEEPAEIKEINIVGDGLSEEFIWRCRTCMACMAVCPACIDHVDTMVDIRRNELLIQGRIPQDAMYALKLLETNGNPFGPQSDRVSWIEKLNIPIIEAGDSCDVLYWVGCCTTFDPTNQRIAQDMCSLLDLCGIDYGMMGKDERCCGDPARLMGEERMFQEIAKKQIEQLSARKFKILLTNCPHCYNVLKNEYKQLGGNYHVLHHSELLHEMLWNGTIEPRYGIERKAVFHDPCYLGRYQRIYDSPREVIKTVPGCELSEMKYNRGQSFCCGGGGGHFWMDLKERKRINNLRIEQVEKTGADTIITACAYCKKMLDDGLKMKDLDEKIEIMDVATLLLNSLRDPRERKSRTRVDTHSTNNDRPGLEVLADSFSAAARVKVQQS